MVVVVKVMTIVRSRVVVVVVVVVWVVVAWWRLFSLVLYSSHNQEEMAPSVWCCGSFLNFRSTPSRSTVHDDDDDRRDFFYRTSFVSTPSDAEPRTKATWKNDQPSFDLIDSYAVIPTTPSLLARARLFSQRSWNAGPDSLHTPWHALRSFVSVVQ